MRYKLNPSWINERLSEIAASGRENKLMPPMTFTYNEAAKWYIAIMANRGRIVKVINLGAGVKRILEEGNICPHCKGRGVI